MKNKKVRQCCTHFSQGREGSSWVNFFVFKTIGKHEHYKWEKAAFISYSFLLIKPIQSWIYIFCFFFIATIIIISRCSILLLHQTMNFEKFRHTGELSDITVVIDKTEFELHTSPSFRKSDYSKKKLSHHWWFLVQILFDLIISRWCRNF